MTEPRRAPSTRASPGSPSAVVALVAAVAVYWALARSGTAPAPPAGHHPAAPRPQPAASSPTRRRRTDPSRPTAAGQARTANGCLGGPDPYQAVLPAQQARHPGPGRRRGVRVDVRPVDRHLPDRPQRPRGARPGRRPRLPTSRAGRTGPVRPHPQRRPATPPPAPPPAPPTNTESGARNQDQTSVTLDLIVYRQSTKATGEVDDGAGLHHAAAGPGGRPLADHRHAASDGQ